MESLVPLGQRVTARNPLYIVHPVSRSHQLHFQLVPALERIFPSSLVPSPYSGSESAVMGKGIPPSPMAQHIFVTFAPESGLNGNYSKSLPQSIA